MASLISLHLGGRLKGGKEGVKRQLGAGGRGGGQVEGKCKGSEICF
jgi:hypothetical protein